MNAINTRDNKYIIPLDIYQTWFEKELVGEMKQTVEKLKSEAFTININGKEEKIDSFHYFPIIRNKKSEST